jgi:hypothetical protein
MKAKTRVKTRKRPLSIIRPWPMDEVSTRNCRHCLAPKEGDYVGCRKGHLMVSTSGKHKRPLAYNGVIRQKRLLKPCQGCKDFDNNWTETSADSGLEVNSERSLAKKVRTAREEHRCGKCGVTIDVGDKFTMRLDKERGFFSCYPVCLKCSGVKEEVRDERIRA